ncbi:MAG TPA: BtrH N-terminal domain-containing protein [Bacillota bacterium]|nr:BtrH N-terminal domain-containing protein [Bacillota bacterium]
MEKKITLRHHVHDYECMWNGIEDLYIAKSGEALPESFFFLLASFGAFCYLHTNSQDIKRMIMFGDGRTKKMYEYLAPIVEFQYKHYSYTSFDSLLKTVIREIDDDKPVVLGAMDMFYLPYFEKIYHKEHIPFHYVLANGYDLDKKTVYVYDGARENQIGLSFKTLEEALDCYSPGLSKKNTLCKIRMGETRSKYSISKLALAKKARAFLNPPTNFLGIKGMEKLIDEIKCWDKELSQEDIDQILENMLMFLGSVPTLPNRLKKLNEKDQVTFKGNYDKVCQMMDVLANEYADKAYLSTIPYFYACAQTMEKISDLIVDHLLMHATTSVSMPLLLAEIKDNLEKAFKILL